MFVLGSPETKPEVEVIGAGVEMVGMMIQAMKGGGGEGEEDGEEEEGKRRVEIERILTTFRPFLPEESKMELERVIAEKITTD